MRRQPALGPETAHIVVYTRRNCHLCEEVHEWLRERQARYRFNLETVDVDTDPDLAARYGDTVPVVKVNGQVRFRGKINLVLLDRLLRAEIGSL
jgi:glutaredoxin